MSSGPVAGLSSGCNKGSTPTCPCDPSDTLAFIIRANCRDQRRNAVWTQRQRLPGAAELETLQPDATLPWTANRPRWAITSARTRPNRAATFWSTKPVFPL